MVFLECLISRLQSMSKFQSFAFACEKAAEGCVLA